MSIQSAVRTGISGAAITLVATLVSIYIVSQFLRNSVGVIAPNLAADLGLSPAEIGLLSSIFFLAFAAVQIPLGMALDRFGPRIWSAPRSRSSAPSCSRAPQAPPF